MAPRPLGVCGVRGKMLDTKENGVKRRNQKMFLPQTVSLLFCFPRLESPRIDRFFHNDRRATKEVRGALFERGERGSLPLRGLPELRAHGWKTRTLVFSITSWGLGLCRREDDKWGEAIPNRWTRLTAPPRAPRGPMKMLQQEEKEEEEEKTRLHLPRKRPAVAETVEAAEAETVEAAEDISRMTRGLI